MTLLSRGLTDNPHSLVELWCSDIDLSSDTSKSLTADDIGASGYERTTFKFEWQDKEGACTATCQEIFHSFGEVSECEPLPSLLDHALNC